MEEKKSDLQHYRLLSSYHALHDEPVSPGLYRSRTTVDNTDLLEGVEL